MSQEKVDRYKQEKANRKKIMKKQKVSNALRKCVVAAAALLLVVWIGYSAYDVYESNKEPEKVQIDYRAFNEFSEKLTDASTPDQEETEEKDGEKTSQEAE